MGVRLWVKVHLKSIAPKKAKCCCTRMTRCRQERERNCEPLNRIEYKALPGRMISRKSRSDCDQSKAVKIWRQRRAREHSCLRTRVMPEGAANFFPEREVSKAIVVER